MSSTGFECAWRGARYPRYALQSARLAQSIQHSFIHHLAQPGSRALSARALAKLGLRPRHAMMTKLTKHVFCGCSDTFGLISPKQPWQSIHPSLWLDSVSTPLHGQSQGQNIDQCCSLDRRNRRLPPHTFYTLSRCRSCTRCLIWLLRYGLSHAECTT